MKTAEIKGDGKTPFYYATASDWRAPRYGQPNSHPVVRVDNERYYRASEWSAVQKRSDGKLIKVATLLEDGTLSGTRYVTPGHIRGPWEELHAEIAAHCKQRDAATAQATKERLAQRDELGDLLAQLADAIGQERPVGTNPVGWGVEYERWSYHARVGVEGLRAVLGHIRRQEELIERLEDERNEARRDVRYVEALHDGSLTRDADFPFGH